VASSTGDAVKQVGLGERQSDWLVRSIGARLQVQTLRRFMGSRSRLPGAVRSDWGRTPSLDQSSAHHPTILELRPELVLWTSVRVNEPSFCAI
jgi:hypothetical protein